MSLPVAKLKERAFGLGASEAAAAIGLSQYRTPLALYQQKIEGDVNIAYSLDRTGAVTDARVASATPARVFDQAALESFKQWRFTPMLDKSGNPISASGFKFTLAFRLGR